MRPKIINNGQGVQLSDGGVVARGDWRAIQAGEQIRRFAEEEDGGMFRSRLNLDDGQLGSASYAARRREEGGSELPPKNQPAREQRSPIWGFSEKNKTRRFAENLKTIRQFLENAPDEADREQARRELRELFAGTDGEQLQEAAQELGIGEHQRPAVFKEIERRLFGEQKPEPTEAERDAEVRRESFD